MTQIKINNNKLNITNTNNIKGEFKTWFWNNSANESSLNTEKKRDKKKKKDKINKSNSEIEKPSIKKIISSKIEIR